MTLKTFSDAMSELDSKYIDEALSYKKKSKKLVWVGLGAACLCLVAAGAVLLSMNNSITTGETSTSDDIIGGEIIGDNSNMYLVSVFPANESIENIKSAEIKSLTESEAMNNPLAKHLPKQIPEGFHYGRGSISNTVMKNGKQYSLLKVEYITGEIPEQQYTDDGGAISFDTSILGNYFTIKVWSFDPSEPNLDNIIFSSSEEVTMSLFKEKYWLAYIQTGGCYVSLSNLKADQALVLEALRSIE